MPREKEVEIVRQLSQLLFEQLVKLGCRPEQLFNLTLDIEEVIKLVEQSPGTSFSESDWPPES